MNFLNFELSYSMLTTAAISSNYISSQIMPKSLPLNSQGDVHHGCLDLASATGNLAFRFCGLE
jgi:hypothetical protein